MSFEIDGPSNGTCITRVAGEDNQFLVNEAGVYQITYELNVQEAGRSFALFANGVLLAGTTYGENSQGLLTGRAIVTLFENDVVTLQNLNGEATLNGSVTGFGVVSASIIFEQWTTA
ncbi:BclA C-terminal domain-containing protein [Brevibacillus sp. SAFN-007a]|uniref:BclA C-terminal domain-containing protein n=1 Tax=Brevibacillus sp. SAFN-007a TaxID=3436862 RepID=UPI003F7ED9EB